MDAVQLAALKRRLLAEGVGWLWREALDEECLQRVWDEQRGRCCERVLSFPLLVEVAVSQALWQHGTQRLRAVFPDSACRFPA